MNLVRSKNFTHVLALSAVLLGAFCGCSRVSSDDPDLLGELDTTLNEKTDFKDGEVLYFADGTRFQENEPLDFEKDVKMVEVWQEGDLFTDFPNGYSVRVPSRMQFDFGCSPDFARLYGEDLEIRISKDASPYADVLGWLSELPNEFLADENYLKSNHITVHDDTWIDLEGKKARVFSLTRSPRAGKENSGTSYLYAYIYFGGINYFTLHFRSASFTSLKETASGVIESFQEIEPAGHAVYNLDFKPILPDFNAETQELYRRISQSRDLLWGLFTPNVFTDQGNQKLLDVEGLLDFEFPVILSYIYLGHPFPYEGMEQAYEAGKIVELTLQIQGDMFGENPNFLVFDGLLDDQIRDFAKSAKEFGHPFLFRLNNEMNSTWVSYSGHLCLCDPDIFKENWIRVYKIFEEEGVDNAIWIFNPNDVSFPPAKWNSHVAYYPGNEYVHMIGLTGYNTGDYFRDVTGERWRSFTEIYDRVWDMYKDIYKTFPWIITEFSCSSVGGDKKAWIQEMFLNLPRYENIKIAVWWSYYDPDPRPQTLGTPARRYWLDEDPEYIDAFKGGLKNSGG